METGLSSIKARIAGLCLHAGGSSRCAYIAHAAVCVMMASPFAYSKKGWVCSNTPDLSLYSGSILKGS